MNLFAKHGKSKKKIVKLASILCILVFLVSTLVVLQSQNVMALSQRLIWISQSSCTISNLSGVTFANGMFVGIGDSGTIITSNDGETWTGQTSGTTNQLNGITYGNGTFVVVGDKGTILTSPDGVTWTKRITNITDHLTGVTFGNGTYVAVGWHDINNGTILTSPDGVNWNIFNSDTRWLFGITYGNINGIGTFAAVGDDSILTSSDGFATDHNWYDDWPLLGSGSAFNGVAYGSEASTTYGSSAYIAVGGHISYMSDTSDIYEYNGGTTWNKFTPVANFLYGVTYGNGAFVAVGEKGTVVSITDSIYSQTLNTTESLRGVTYGNGTFVAVGDGGTIFKSSPYVLASPPLTPATTNNTVGQSVNLTYVDNPAWRAAISGITVDGTALNSSQYTVTPGKINIAAGVFTTGGNHTIVVKAMNYNDDTVTQTMQINETLTVSNTSTTGFTVTLNPELPGLTVSNFKLLDSSSKPITITGVATLDSGATYKINAVLNAGQTYTITAINTGYTFGTAQSVVVPLTPKPTIVTGLRVSNITSNELDLTWNTVSEAISYNIYRSVSETGTFTIVGTSNTTTYSDKNLTANTAYYYKVSAVNTSGEGLLCGMVVGFTENPTHTITYDGNGNTGGTVPVDPNVYIQGSTVTVLGNTGVLVKIGYTFGGWNTLVNGSGTNYTSGNTFSMGMTNVTLYAKWTAIIYGDVDGNGKINQNDYDLVKQYILGRITGFPSSKGISAADIDSDGKITSRDEALLLRIVQKNQ